ncbi:MAG TPA: hypothetical protein VLW26_02960 [Steroidobacteraceae bacterium]|nr:hypothetical protein [Steroidobacteraceae bacterium]
MRLILVLSTALAVTACAPATAPKPAPETHTVKVDATNVEDAEKAGYTVINKNGEKLYCQRNLATGSHIQKETRCLTEAEVKELEATRSLSQTQSKTPVFRGGG